VIILSLFILGLGVLYSISVAAVCKFPYLRFEPLCEVDRGGDFDGVLLAAFLPRFGTYIDSALLPVFGVMSA
jgi:hypothetical protein